MSTSTDENGRLRAAIARNRPAVDNVLARYGATNPRLFGSVARGDATESSDVDILVDLESGNGNPLLRIAGIGHELSELFGRRVDVVTVDLLRYNVSSTALSDAVAL